MTQFIGAGLFEVSLPGFMLIAEAISVKGSDYPPLPIQKIKIDGVSGSWWLNQLAAYAATVTC